LGWVGDERRRHCHCIPALPSSSVRTTQRCGGFDAATTNNDNDGHDDEADDDYYDIVRMAVRRATVRRFEVRLDVVDAGVMASRSSAAYSILRGAFGGGAATTGNDINEAEEDADVASGMALRAHVIVDGLDVVLAPSGEEVDDRDGRRRPRHRRRSWDGGGADDPAESNPGFFSSLFDSAMRSLRPSIDVTNVSIRVPGEGQSVDENATLTGASLGCPVGLRNPLFLFAWAMIFWRTRGLKKRRSESRDRSVCVPPLRKKGIRTRLQWRRRRTLMMGHGSEDVDYNKAEEEAETELWVGQMDEWKDMDRNVFDMMPTNQRATPEQ